MTFAFAAAGTGGHVYPALAVADALVAGGVARSDIVFFGGDRMEADVVPNAGYRFIPLDIQGLRRSLTPKNLMLPAKVRRATTTIEGEIDRFGVRAVTVFGGYVSVPAAWAAKRKTIPLYLHEQNAVPGLANRLITRWAHKSFIAFPAASDQLQRTELVGNPLRPALLNFDRPSLRSEARKRYDIREDVTVLGVLGGSLGAKVLNETTERIAAGVDPDRVAIVHLTGPMHIEDVRMMAKNAGALWRPVAFEREMEFFYAAVDLVLARSGALTISELAVTGTPAIVVPLEATNQGANAEYLASAGGVLLIEQTDIDRVPWQVEQLLVDREQRRTMAQRAKALALPDAATIMAAEIREAAGA